MPTVTFDCIEITKTYTTIDPPTQILHGIDFQVPGGEFLVIMGAPGFGKSTLLHNISGMDQPTAGTVRPEGRELTGLSDKEVSRVRPTRMGFVFRQAYSLSNPIIRDDMLLPALRADPRGASEVASQVDALLGRFGIGHVKQRGTMGVSGGQLQCTPICRMLVGEPAVVLVDEPTEALSNFMTVEVMDVLPDVYAEGRAIVMVTHDPAYTARADRVVYLRDGWLVDSRFMERWRPEQTTQYKDGLLA